MILVDADPLVAIIDRGKPDSQACAQALSSLAGPMVTTWPALSDAIAMLGVAGGWSAQDALWKLLERGDLQLIDLDESVRKRSRALMAKYRDLPMDLADATLVAAAEAIDVKRVFTLNSQFRIYRFRNRQPFEIIP